MVKWIESSRCRWDRRRSPSQRNLKSSNCVVYSVPHFLLDVLHLPPRFPDLGDPDDETSGTLDGVTWMDAFVVKIHPDHFVPWMSVGWNRVNQGNYATKTTWRVEDKDRLRWVGQCCPGLGIIRFVGLLKIAFRDRYFRFVECHNSPRVHSLVWHFQGKLNDFYIGTGVDRSEVNIYCICKWVYSFAPCKIVLSVFSQFGETHWKTSSENRDFLWLDGRQIPQKRSC